MSPDLRAIGRGFEIEGEFESAEPFGSGHINDTYRAVYRVGGVRRRFVHQRINHKIFSNPAALMENIERVLGHLKRKLAGASEIDRRALTLVSARDAGLLHRDEQGGWWRTYLHLEGGRTYDVVEHAGHARESGRAFGEFQRLLADFPAPRLHETIPDFHHTPKRFEALERAVAADASNRARGAEAEIDFALRRKPLASVLHELQTRGEIPERIAHNDAKFNNVVIDDATRESLCVIDLDTVMPGLALHDFGDMVRTVTSPAAEDERDLSKVELRLPLFEALVDGYLSTAGGFLNAVEKKHLVAAGKLITFEVGIRFLADHLSGDTYFKVRREGHNLDRCRTQFKLVESIERQESEMNRLVERAAAKRESKEPG